MRWQCLCRERQWQRQRQTAGCRCPRTLPAHHFLGVPIALTGTVLQRAGSESSWGGKGQGEEGGVRAAGGVGGAAPPTAIIAGAASPRGHCARLPWH